MNISRQSKKVLFILGMHRSGTSALAGCINLSGISGGRELLEPGFDNEKGFFENRRALQINEGILAELDLSWDSPFALPDTWTADGRLRKHKKAIANFLTSELMNRPALYVKDPRLSFLLPLWLEVLQELQIESACLVVVRHPAEVFQSLRKRNTLDKNKALSLWLNHVLQAEKNSRHLPRRIVFYDDLLENPVATVEQSLRHFELLPPEKDWHERRKSIQNFIEKKLKHHDAARTGDGMERLPYFPTLFNLLEKLAAEPGDPAVLAEIDRQRGLFDFNLQFFTPAPKRDFFATLKLECGEKTRLVAPVQLPVFEGLEKLVFNLAHVAEPIEKAMLFPCDELCHVSLDEVKITYADGSEDAFEPAQRKVLIEHGVEFLFEPQDYVVVEPKPGKQVESIVFDIVYEHVGEAALASVTDFAKSIRGWFSERSEQREAEFEQEKSSLQEQFDKENGQNAEQIKLISLQIEPLLKQAEQLSQDNQQFKTENALLQSMLEVEKKQVQTLEGQFKAQQSAAWELDRQLQSAFANLREKTVQIVDLQEKMEAGEQALAIETHQTETLASRLEIEKQAHQSTRQAHDLTKQAHESERLAHQSARQEIEATTRQLEAARLETDAAKRQIEAANRQIETAKNDLAAARLAQKQKDDQIWELFSKNQNLESSYRQALVTLDEERSSVSYRLGRFLTAPMRWIFDAISSGKPFNQTKLWLFLQFLAAALAMPFAMLAHLNGKNISTLRKALKNESPRQIVGNLRKLLLGNQASQAPQASPTESLLSLPEATSASSQAAPRDAEVPFGNDKATGADAEPTSAGFETLPTLNVNSRKKTVLFASPHLPDFDASSGGKRATRLLTLLAQDCEVYAFTLGDKPEKHVQKLETAGVRVFQTTDFQEVKQVVPQVDVLIFSFFYTWFDCGEFLKLYPNAKLIVDTVDVHWVRHERSIGLWEELTEEVVRQKKALEIGVYQKADVIWAVTKLDRQAILAEVPEADVRIVSNVHAVEVSEWQDPGTYNLLFFGGFAHYPNIIAVKELVFRIFPKIREQVPDAKLLIAGSNAPPEVEEMGKLPGVEFLGFVDEDQLADLYRQTFLALVPLQTGAGIKGKICEAIAFGVPVVTNKIGNEGIELANEESGLISNDKNELVRLTVKALRREYDFAKMVAAAQERLQLLVGPDVVKKNMLESFGAPGISICIVTWNKQALLQRCIESIENHTQYPHYQILVYSNGCTDGTREYLEAAAKINPRIVPILSQTNDVFVIPNNRMMQLFPQNDVVLLNNDTYVTGGWLEALREAAYSSDEIGIAGAKLLYPNGILQEFGSELYANGTGRNIGKGEDPNQDAYSRLKYSGYVSGCAFYVKRETINKIGVFDVDFHPCYCEDSDYCYTAWEHNIATIVTPKCVIYHDEGSTSGTDVNKGAKAYQKINFEKFLKKHGGRLDEITSRIKLKNIALASGNGAASATRQNGAATAEKPAEKIARSLSQVAQNLDGLHFYSISNSEFEHINEAWQGVVKGIKTISYRPGDRKSLEDFEKIWAAQSIQFMVDMLPDVQAILLKYYERSNVLECADIGAGNAAGSNLVSQIHADHMVYSKMNVTAVDHVDHSRRWAISQYPAVQYKTANLYGLPTKAYDIVLCSNCLEHVTYPEKFVRELLRVCRGFAFIYTPYDEQDMIPGHINRITEDFYKGFPVEQIRIFHSLAWAADQPEKKMILAILDGRNKELAS